MTGRVAQLVEQRTENPRVDSSILSSATISPILVLLALCLGGCSDDPCAQLCQSVGQRLGGCIEEWDASWDFFGATRQRQFVTSCQDDWSELRVDLEVRQINASEEACDDALAELRGLTCDELRALYF